MNLIFSIFLIIIIISMVDFKLTDFIITNIFYYYLISGLDSTCYPEILGKMLVINVPFLAIKTWNIVKRWLDPRTLSKIEVISDHCNTVL